MAERRNRIAVIDIGSHSILMLAGEVMPDGQLSVIDQQFRTAGLAEGMDSDNRITPEAMDRVLQILKEMDTRLRELNIEKVFPVGTAALRKAVNVSELEQRIKETLKWNLKIVSALEEADMSFMGVLQDFADSEQQILVMDVGGGSTELALGRKNKIEHRQSIEIGAVSAAKKVNFKEILCSSDRLGIMNLIMLGLQDIDWLDEIGSDCTLIGTGGTLSTLAAIKAKMQNYNPEIINQMTFCRDEIWDLFFSLNQKSFAERKKVIGLNEGREHILIYGILIFLTLMQMKQIELIRVSDKGFRYGYLKYVLSNKVN